jgi:hypothetical protein
MDAAVSPETFVAIYQNTFCTLAASSSETVKEFTRLHGTIS